MATTQNNPAGKSPRQEPDESLRAGIDSGKAKFVITTPNPGFTGERAGIRFMGGVGYTDDSIRAHACLEFGYTVIDAKTGREKWPKDAPPDPKQGDGVK